MQVIAHGRLGPEHGDIRKRDHLGDIHDLLNVIVRVKPRHMVAIWARHITSIVDIDERRRKPILRGVNIRDPANPPIEL
jgi:hypothetical protein